MSTVSVMGMGAATGYGWGKEHLWRGLVSGKSAAALHDGFGSDPVDPGWVGIVPPPSDAPVDERGQSRTRYGHAVQSVAREAVHDAQLRGWRPGPTVGIVHATVLGDLDMYPFVAPGAAGGRPRDYVRITPSTPLTMTAAEHGFRGPVVGVSAMCASGVAAVLTAQAWLDAELVDDVLVLATDLSATPEVVRMFRTLGVAVTDVEPASACRPFQAESRGFTFAEAGAGLVLTRSGPGERYGAIAGGAMRHDGHHPTSIDPSLSQVRACVESALQRAGVRGTDIRHVHAHGPGTRQCDAAEMAVTADLTPQADLWSIKPLVGHCQAAAGAIELVASLLTHERGVLPAAPVAGDPLTARLIDGCVPAGDPDVSMKLSIGMGGHTAAVVVTP